MDLWPNANDERTCEREKSGCDIGTMKWNVYRDREILLAALMQQPGYDFARAFDAERIAQRVGPDCNANVIRARIDELRKEVAAQDAMSVPFEPLYNPPKLEELLNAQRAAVTTWRYARRILKKKTRIVKRREAMTYDEKRRLFSARRQAQRKVLRRHHQDESMIDESKVDDTPALINDMQEARRNAVLAFRLAQKASEKVTKFALVGDSMVDDEDDQDVEVFDTEESPKADKCLCCGFRHERAETRITERPTLPDPTITEPERPKPAEPAQARLRGEKRKPPSAEPPSAEPPSAEPPSAEPPSAEKDDLETLKAKLAEAEAKLVKVQAAKDRANQKRREKRAIRSDVIEIQKRARQDAQAFHYSERGI